MEQPDAVVRKTSPELFKERRGRRDAQPVGWFDQRRDDKCLPSAGQLLFHPGVPLLPLFRRHKVRRYRMPAFWHPWKDGECGIAGQYERE